MEKKFFKNNEFEGKNIIVTGGTGGIGSEVVTQLCAKGGKVALLVRDEKKAFSKFGTLIT